MSVPNHLPPILDFEASSLSDNSYPISVGLLAKGRLYYWVIKPEPHWLDWNPKSQEIHGLSREYIETQGTPAAQVYLEIMALVKDEPYVFSDNPDWEHMWFSRLGDHDFEFMHVFRLLNEQSRALFGMYRSLMIEHHKLTAHRADHDVLAIAYAIGYLLSNNN